MTDTHTTTPDQDQIQSPDANLDQDQSQDVATEKKNAVGCTDHYIFTIVVAVIAALVTIGLSADLIYPSLSAALMQGFFIATVAGAALSMVKDADGKPAPLKIFARLTFIAIGFIALFTALFSQGMYDKHSERAAEEIVKAVDHNDFVFSRSGPFEEKDLPEFLKNAVDRHVGYETTEARLFMLSEASKFERNSGDGIGIVCPKLNSWGRPLRATFNIEGGTVHFDDQEAPVFFCEKAAD